MRARFRATLAFAALLAAPVASPAFVGHDDVTYPVRYQVAALATFNGHRPSFDTGFFEMEDVHDRRIERDVLSFDSPTELHWERALPDGSFLVGNWSDDTGRWDPVNIRLAGHPELIGGEFPFNRHAGICRAGVELVWLNHDVSKLRGRGSYRIARDGVVGTTRFRLKGRRL